MAFPELSNLELLGTNSFCGFAFGEGLWNDVSFLNSGKPKGGEGVARWFGSGADSLFFSEEEDLISDILIFLKY